MIEQETGAPESARRQSPSREDPLAGALSESIGGPAGAHSAGHPWWTPVRVMLAVFTVVFSLTVIQKAPCVQTDWSNDGVRYAKMCYSDIPYLYTGRGFAEKHWPYADSGGRYPVMEYPVLISYFAWGAAEITGLMASGPPQAVRAAASTDQLWGLPGMIGEVDTYVLVTAALLFCCGVGAVVLLAGVDRRRPWDAMGFAASPALLAAGLVNWDLFAVLFVAAALWAWARGRPFLAGMMVGLGTATKLYPLFLLGAFLVDLIRRRRIPPLLPLVAGAALSWLLVNLPVMAENFSAWRVFWSFNDGRSADLGSFWLVLDQLGVHSGTGLINLLSGLVFALACVGILWLGLSAPRPARPAQLAFLIVAAFLMVNKVYSPQYVLWLLPLAALARPRWRDLLLWQAGEVVYFAAVWIYLAGGFAPASGSVPTGYHLAILIRLAAEAYLVARVVGDVRAGRSGHLDAVEPGGGEPDPDVDLLADLGDGDAGRQVEHRGLHVRRLGEVPSGAGDGER